MSKVAWSSILPTLTGVEESGELTFSHSLIICSRSQPVSRVSDEWRTFFATSTKTGKKFRKPLPENPAFIAARRRRWFSPSSRGHVMGLKMRRECRPPWTQATLSSPNTTGKVLALLGECMIAGLFRIYFNACGSETTRRSSYGAISFLRV
jgi:hypothetical protein